MFGMSKSFIDQNVGRGSKKILLYAFLRHIVFLRVIYMRAKVKLGGQMFRACSSYMTYMVKNLKTAKNDDFDDF